MDLSQLPKEDIQPVSNLVNVLLYCSKCLLDIVSLRYDGGQKKRVG